MSKRHLFSRSGFSSLEGKLPSDGLVRFDASTRVEVTLNGSRVLFAVPVVSRNQITLIMENGGTIGLRFIETK